MKSILIAAAFVAAAGSAHAQASATATATAGTAVQAGPTAPPKIERLYGVVTALSATEITLKTDAGDKTVKLAPDWTVSVSRPVTVDQIKPGSYLGTTNHAKPDGTGTSTEIHVSPPGVTGMGVDFVMSETEGTTMTNGVVTTVVASEGGRVLAVDYGRGVRRITVPPGIPIVENSPGDRAAVKVGETVRFLTFTPATGGPSRQIVSVGVGGPPPR